MRHGSVVSRIGSLVNPWAWRRGGLVPARFGSTALTLQESAQGLYWSIEPEHQAMFAALGLNRCNFFPHQLRFVRRPGSDGAKLAHRMYGLKHPDRGFELLLHAAPEVCREFPSDLFFNHDIVWHQQHLGLPGHVAVANLVLEGKRLYTTVRFSDIVQRISLRRDLKTRVERVFRGWNQMLLNGIIHFATHHGVREIWLPTADLAMENTDRARNPQRMLFERVYDAHLSSFQPRRQGQAWVLDVASARQRHVPPVRRLEECSVGRTVCIVHDTERGLGSPDSDPALAARADRDSPAALQRMLAVEAQHGVQATYSVVGCYLKDVRAAIMQGGHELAFHSFDHTRQGDQVLRCRQVDYRIPGYRPPQSRLTPELRDGHLAIHNFEWLASSEYSLGFPRPSLSNGVVKLPIKVDDYPLHAGQLIYDQWWDRVKSSINERSYLAVGLHDCYAEHWLEQYPDMLTCFQDHANVRRLGDVANLLLRQATV